uniref:CRAL-TRIO domain-containing protein n=1 Tax=Timema poppense TaxID=170557 RepID=A0A7R9D701_TIMPO|nr:unnamed protein product [Timema poppensis]
MTTQFGNYRTFTETPDVHDIREQVATPCQPVPYRTAKLWMNALSTIRPRLCGAELRSLVAFKSKDNIHPDLIGVVREGITKDIIPPNVADGMKLVLMIGDIRLKEELTGVAGDVYILDASVATAAHFAKFTPSIVKKFLVCVQEAYPVKLKEVHVVNVSPLVDTIINFAKPFLKEKIRNRIFCHPDGYESLYKYIPQEILPSEYGGYAGPIDVIHREWVKKLDSYTEWFKEQEDIKADESKRPGKPKTHDDLFGLEGMHQPRCSSGKRVWERRICLPQTYLPKIAKVCLNVGGPRAMQRIRASKTSTVCLLLKKWIAGKNTSTKSPLEPLAPMLRETEAISKAEFLTFLNSFVAFKKEPTPPIKIQETAEGLSS